MTKILGLNAFHADASAALIIDGKIVSAVEEERFIREKHWAGFPSESVKWILYNSKIKISDIDEICINTNPNANFYKKLIYTFKNNPDIRFLLERYKNKQKRKNVFNYIQELFPNQEINANLNFVDHHLAHLASAFYCSRFEEASVVSIDGFGDFASTAWGFGSSNKLRLDQQIFFPHSLGVFYTSLTQFLGFPNYGDEYKVMGLAPYGNKKYVDKIWNLINLEKNGKFSLNKKYFLHTSQKIPYKWDNCTPEVGTHYSKELIEILGPERKSDQILEKRHMDIAHSAQFVYEEVLNHILRNVHKIYGGENLAIAGGCAANSVANGKITKNTPFKKLYVQAAAGDAGGALGSALKRWYEVNPRQSASVASPYLGSFASQNEIDKLLFKRLSNNETLKNKFLIKKIGEHNLKTRDHFLDEISNYIIDGLVIGWFQGRMEWGPRALGNRSILGDPRRKDMKNILNAKIKRRESFRPFAPSVLYEEAKDWFEFPDHKKDDEVPYMMKVLPIKKDRRELIPAVTHVDGSGRLQTVNRNDNETYYDLIKSFFQKTGVPMLLNTSFNENEPIVRTPAEALDCFIRTKMDVLVIGETIIKREIFR